jgi:hypothetical protein
MNTDTFIGAAGPVFIGFATHKLLLLARRKKESRNTPYHFDWKFWVHDNWISAVFHLMISVTVILFLPDILDGIAGYEHTPKQVAGFINSFSTKVWMLIFGFLAAMPMTWWERKSRDLKKKLNLMKFK